MSLHVQSLSVTYNKGEASESLGLPPVTFELRPGQPLVISGPNGCGKTTLLKVLAGHIAPTRGKMSCGEAPGDMSIDLRWLRTRSAYLWQDPCEGLFPDLTLAENVALSLPRSGWFAPYFPDHSFRFGEETVTQLVPFYDSHRGHRVTELSGGQQQLFATACAGVSEKNILLFDEPTSALDPSASARIEALLKSLCLKDRVMSLLVTHDGNLASRLGFASMKFDQIAEPVS